jgi:glutamate racemase
VVTRRTPASPRRSRRVRSGDDRAIGIFDSGIGGLTVVRALRAVLPDENLIYLGDTGRYPYGTKSADVVTRYSFENTEFLVDKGVKMLVIACNTSTAVALAALQARYDLPVIGVIEPGVEGAIRATRNRKIGVIATEGTIRNGEYTRALRRSRPDLEIYTRACPLFVPLAEEGWTDGDVAELAARAYLGTLAQSGIDTLILGCTHYPLLRGVIRKTVGRGVRLIDSGVVTASAVAAALDSRGLRRRTPHGSGSFFVTDAPERFMKVGARFLGAPVDAVQIER